MQFYLSQAPPTLTIRTRHASGSFVGGSPTTYSNQAVRWEGKKNTTEASGDPSALPRSTTFFFNIFPTWELSHLQVYILFYYGSIIF